MFEGVWGFAVNGPTAYRFSPLSLRERAGVRGPSTPTPNSPTPPSIRLEPIPTIAQMQPHRRARGIAVLAPDRLIDRLMLQARQLP